MPTPLEEVNESESGADFVRADLHVHSYGVDGSHDVTDETLTPEAIVDSALANGIHLLAITDHQRIGNSEKAVEYSQGKDILVLPAVELSTNEGHLLVYAPTIDKLRRIVGRLEISDDYKTCRSTIKAAADIAVSFDGFAITAHIDNEKGFEGAISGYGDSKQQIVTHAGILGFEISTKESLAWYTDTDEEEQRRLLSKGQVTGRGFTIAERARIMSSDAHQTARLWKNAAGEERITRIKIAEMTFDAVRIALMDPTARIKLEENLPSSTPQFIGVKFEGGFLDQQVVKFNKNLNAIIGGRGSGKSTMLESVKVASGNETHQKDTNEFRLIDGDVWADKITLYYRDEVGNITEFVREKNEELINQTDPINGIKAVPIESYGQGDLTRVISDSESEPEVLNEFLDRFIDFEDLKVNDEDLRTRLFTNHSKITELETQIAQLPQYLALYKQASSKLEALKTENVKELVELEESLATERALRSEINDEVDRRKDLVVDGLKAVSEFSIDELLEDKNISVGKEEVEAIQTQIRHYSELADKASADFDTKSGSILDIIDTSLEAWGKKEQVHLKKISDKKNELIAKGVKPDMAWIKSLATDHAKYEQRIRNLRAKEIEKNQLLKDRASLISQRESIKRDIYSKRISFAQKMNIQFNQAVIDYEVKIKYKEGLFSPTFAELIQRTMEWRTSQVPKAPLIASNLSPREFVAAITSRNLAAFSMIKDSSGNVALTSQDIVALLRCFTNTDRIKDVEELIYEDRPTITVSKIFIDDDGNRVVKPRNFHKLSLGQQQAICLTILLNSGKNSPLIIDQPEDNLDSEFIYKTLVTTLRRIKEQRQVIVVTHNANIAVLGDAELIIPLRATNDKAIVTSRGSIDTKETKELACTILEGGSYAFNRRQEMYGIEK